jgi:hypothetical protein
MADKFFPPMPPCCCKGASNIKLNRWCVLAATTPTGIATPLGDGILLAFDRTLGNPLMRCGWQKPFSLRWPLLRVQKYNLVGQQPQYQINIFGAVPPPPQTQTFNAYGNYPITPDLPCDLPLQVSPDGQSSVPIFASQILDIVIQFFPTVNAAVTAWPALDTSILS